MNIEDTTIKLLGAAFLFVFVASLLSERLLTLAVGSGSISTMLVNISKNLTLLRLSNLVALLNSFGIVGLAALLYIVFNKQSAIISLVALGLWLIEAMMLVVSKLGAYALLPLSQEFVAAESPKPAYFQTVGEFLYYAVDRQGYLIHNLFFCVGGILWYYLFFSTGSIPQIISVWGLAAVGLLTIPILLTLYNRNFSSLMILALPYAPFELILGVWLLVKGFN